MCVCVCARESGSVCVCVCVCVLVFITLFMSTRKQACKSSRMKPLKKNLLYADFHTFL